MERPLGEVAEYDALNSLVQIDSREIVERSLELAHELGWGICRARMAAIIETVAARMGWNVDWIEAQRRALILARWPMKGAL